MAKFKARARTIDMLGRQQIAGIPTAINELFKNAHDAYADNVEIDYFRKEKIFILRDNGLGMTKSDFKVRWLTLGTESKFANHKIPAPPKHPDKPERPIMGEKGIGRLAIASIGSQVLILTKALRENENHKIVAALINWRIFELPGLDLDDIIVPIREFSRIPNNDEVKEMQDEIVDSIKGLMKRNDISKNDGNKLIKEIRAFNISPYDLNKKLPATTSLSKSKYGTQFYISPVDETLNHDIDGDKDNKDATKIEKMLVGFTNTMTPDCTTPDIEAAFRDYRSNDGTYFSILDKEQFFTPEDFEMADHHFQGRFDKYGQFSGMIKVYNEKQFDHLINWSGNNFKETVCGSFSINIAYIQGDRKQSIMDAQNHARIAAKGDKYGGLYMYRDNIRILPYGDSNYDFIDIERNRTKSASYYFFSYRRMFGVVNISKETNFQLKEKAGREGFIENKAYRQLRDILKNFFLQLAADFFREGGGPKTDFWIQKRSERESIYKAIERRDKQAKVRKEKFLNSLNRFFKELSSKKYEERINEFINLTDQNIGSVAYIDDTDEATQALLDYELEAREKLAALKQQAIISQPRGFSISKDIRKDYEAYQAEYEKLNGSLFADAERKIDSLVDEYTNRLNLEISKRKRLEQAVDFISSEAKKAAGKKEKETKETVSNISVKVKELTSDLMIGLENKIREVKDQFKTLKIDNVEDFDLVAERNRMEAEIENEKNRSLEILESVIKQLDNIYWEEDQGGNIITGADMNDALTEELYELRERVHADVELSQLGLAVGVIHHEFNSTVKSIRGSIRDLKAWSDVNESLEGVYNNIRINFEHLDGYLTLFTPLNRRLHRKEEDVPANEIKIFLLDLFKARLNRHNIQLKSTKGFSNRKLHGFRSTFYPVFVNIIDNAIHWLNQTSNMEDRIIRLHADDTGVYISNNGPKIPINDKERIFDLGFTRKPNGRGMGLHISREVLEGIKYRLFLDEPRNDSNVTFKIELPKENINV